MLFSIIWLALTMVLALRDPVRSSGTHSSTPPNPRLQVSLITIILGFIRHGTSTIVALLAMTSKTGRIVSKSSSVNLLTSQSEPFRNVLPQFQANRIHHSLATENESVRAKLVNHANDLLNSGVDGFRIDAAKRASSF